MKIVLTKNIREKNSKHQYTPISFNISSNIKGGKFSSTIAVLNIDTHNFGSV